MQDQSQRRGRGARRVAATALSLGVLLTAGVTPATADPVDIDQVSAQLTKYQQESAMAAEKANGARVALAKSVERLGLFRREVTRARVEMKRQQLAVQRLVRELYVNGGMNGALLNFTLDDPAGFLQRLDQLAAAGNARNSVLIKARASALRLQRMQRAVRRETDRLGKAAAVLHAQELQARARVSQASRLLASLQEQERARVLLRDQAQRAASAAAAAQFSEAAGYPSDFAKLPPPRNSSEAVQRVVQFALAQVGKPYVWGAPGPDSFDCSGLTRAAWAQVGVLMTHYSGSQYQETTPVSLNDLQPGDLLYFYSIEQHVGLYIGNGKLVQAANPQAGVILSDLDGYWRSNLVAASRPSLAR
ncbi:MAG TPA: C40 family peptidase [Marmoricola sp.]|nr:C40 family peptidase [Marmoricola sp.]